MVKLLLSEFTHFLSVLQTEKCTVFSTEVLFNDEGIHGYCHVFNIIIIFVSRRDFFCS